MFKLQYQVKAPLSSFFTAGAMDAYGRVSRLVWQLRRAERTLCIAWRTLKVRWRGLGFGGRMTAWVWGELGVAGGCFVCFLDWMTLATLQQATSCQCMLIQP